MYMYNVESLILEQLGLLDLKSDETENNNNNIFTELNSTRINDYNATTIDPSMITAYNTETSLTEARTEYSPIIAAGKRQIQTTKRTDKQIPITKNTTSQPSTTEGIGPPTTKRPRQALATEGTRYPPRGTRQCLIAKGQPLSNTKDTDHHQLNHDKPACDVNDTQDEPFCDQVGLCRENELSKDVFSLSNSFFTLDNDDSTDFNF